MRGKFFVLLLAFSACDECRYADCPTQYDAIRFNYISKSGKDLLNGTDQKYTEKDLALYAFDQNGAKVFSPIQVSTGKGLTIVDATLASDHEAYFEVNKVVTDTLRFEFTPQTSPCCGKFDELTKVFLNRRLMCDDNSLFKIEER